MTFGGAMAMVTKIGLFESIIIIENVTGFHASILYNGSEIEILLRRKKN